MDFLDDATTFLCISNKQLIMKNALLSCIVLRHKRRLIRASVNDSSDPKSKVLSPHLFTNSKIIVK